MLIDNTTSRFLNGHYIFIGLLFLLPCIYGLIQQHWLLFIPNLLLTWFLFATYSGTEIDTEKRKFRTYNCWFGIYKTGTWNTVDNYRGLTLVELNQVYRIYSQSNRSNASVQKQFWVYFVNRIKKPSIPIKKCSSKQQAQSAMDELAIWLKLPVYSLKK